MKRLMPPSLITFLQENPNVQKADCFIVELSTGQLLTATEGQWDITFRADTPGWAGGQTTFFATKFGVWKRGKITSEASTSCTANTMDLSCTPQPGTTFPGTPLGILAAALGHLFDGATVWVYTAYMPMQGYGNVSAGIETKFQGTITKAPKLLRNLVQFECSDPMFLLNMKVPSRLMQSGCPWSFCDSNCGLTAANFEKTIAATTTSQSVLTAALAQPDGYFAQGVATCLTGENAGLSQTVKNHTGNALTLMYPWLLPVAVGDTFSVIKGCDKSVQACAATTHTDGTLEANDYQTRFGGTPFMPVPSTAT